MAIDIGSFLMQFRTTTRKRRRRGNHGSVMTLVLFVMLILLPLGLALLGMGERGRIQATRLSAVLTARAAADAGLIKAVSETNDQLRDKVLGVGMLPQATSEAMPGAEATCSYTVTGDPGAGYAAQSVGQFRAAVSTVHCTLRLQGVFEHAVFAQQGITLKNGSVVDWYNYGTSSIRNQIGTNSTAGGAIVLDNNVIVDGDVVTGVDSHPDTVITDHGATITGGKYAQEEHYPLTPVMVPADIQALPSSGTLTDSAMISTSRKYSGINLRNGATIQITGDVTLYVTGSTSLGNSAEIQVAATNASLTLYLGGNLTGNNSNGFNNRAADPHKLTVYGLPGCRSINFKNSSSFYGALYAPSADTVANNSGNMYGSFATSVFEMKNSATLYYDASLRNVSINDQRVHFVIDRWYED